MSKYRFSIIVPHYDGVISDEQFLEGMGSLAQSTFKDFEVLIYHDGPISRSMPDISQLGFHYSIFETEKRYNDWGHSLRDMGIKQAKGEYLVHFNPDNILDPNALGAIHNSIEIYKGFFTHNKKTLLKDMKKTSVEVVVSPIVMQGLVRFPGGKLFRSKDPSHKLILDGFPPRTNNIDCMQVVASKKAWKKIGGWSDKSEDSDAIMIEKLVDEFSYITCPQIIGMHR